MASTDCKPHGDGSASDSLRRDRWAARRVLSKASSIQRVRNCGRCAHGDSIGVARRGDRAHFTGLVTCGSVWACAVCSARIWAERGEELRTAIDAHHAAGGRVVMVTLTMRHKKGDPLPELWDALGDAWTAARGGSRGARDALQRAGADGWVRVIEATHGAASWHLHVHALVFLSPGLPAGYVAKLAAAGVNVAPAAHVVADLGAAMFEAWAAKLYALSCKRPGACSSIAAYRAASGDLRDGSDLSPTKRARELGARAALRDGGSDGRLRRGGFVPVRDSGGLDVRLVDVGAAGELVGEYVTKAVYGESAAAGEVTGQHAKRARGANRTPWGILSSLARLGLQDDAGLWAEWEGASKGRRALTWSHGLRDRLLTEPERSDDEIAEESDTDRVVVGILDADTWAAIYERRGAACMLLELVEAVPLERARSALDAGLVALGLPASRPPPEIG